MRTVVVPPLAGLFSAAGLLFARTEFHDVRFCQRRRRASRTSTLLERPRGGDARRASARRSAPARSTSGCARPTSATRGQSWDIEVDVPGERHRRGVGRRARRARSRPSTSGSTASAHEEGSPVEIRALRLAVLGPAARGRDDQRAAAQPATSGRGTRSRDFGDGAGRDARCSRARRCRPTGRSPGPLLIDEYDTTVVVPPGWSVRRERERRARRWRRRSADAGAAATSTTPDAIVQEIVANALASIADEMATTIFRTAHSTVVRDVMDFSAALCDPRGETVAQAVTIPLHLGSIPTAMRTLLERFGGRMSPGDIFVMNDPFDGGMHTPDIYVVKPVFARRRADRLRRHRRPSRRRRRPRCPARAPATTPRSSRRVSACPWLRLYRDGRAGRGHRSRSSAPTCGSRAMTMGDLNAQIAACNDRRARRCRSSPTATAPTRLVQLMARLVDHTERLVRSEIASWPDGTATLRRLPRLRRHRRARRADRGRAHDRTATKSPPTSPTRRRWCAARSTRTRSFTEATVYQAVMSARQRRDPEHRRARSGRSTSSRSRARSRTS